MKAYKSDVTRQTKPHRKHNREPHLEEQLRNLLEVSKHGDVWHVYSDKYNNNNDWYSAIRGMAKRHGLPLEAFMYNGRVYVEVV